MISPTSSIISMPHPQHNSQQTVPSTTFIALFMDQWDEIKISLSDLVVHLGVARVTVAGKGVEVAAIQSKGSQLTLKLSQPLLVQDIGKMIVVSLEGIKGTGTVVFREVLNDPAFYYAASDLGSSYTPSQTTFKVWSPVASRVEVLLFKTATDTLPYKTLMLSKGENGVWSAVKAGNLAGIYYQLQLHSYGLERITVDPYSQAASNYFENQDRLLSKSVVVNLEATHPAGWDSYIRPTLPKRTDAAVYEVHVRDFSIHHSSGITHKGKYLGMIEKGTRVLGTAHASGLDHLLELGINTVQLLPVYDFGNETEGAYNWGYDPYLYNVPEAQYSTQPHNPAATILEFKQMVMGLHEAGLNVIMDVVYNHTKHTGERSPFDQVVPGYYYRTDSRGQYLNETGVGNVWATERPMVRKFIVDSLKYWVAEYHIQGFRFDLMGTFDALTVQSIALELTVLDSHIVMYGEPWAGDGAARFDKGAQKGLNIGVFNDNFRNAITGGVFDILEGGLMQGQTGVIAQIKAGLIGSIDDFTLEPGESTNYATSHDNFLLWDRIDLRNRKYDQKWDVATQKAMQKMAAALVLTAQGLAFISGGEEFCRSKQGDTPADPHNIPDWIHNSYNAGDFPNAFDWNRLITFSDVNTYYQGMIKIRLEHPVFRLASAAEVRSSLTFLPLEESKNLVGFVLDGSKVAGETWRKIVVIFNGSFEDQEVKLPKGDWIVVARGDMIATVAIGKPTRGTITLPRLSTLIGYQN
jgi:pullulanase